LSVTVELTQQLCKQVGAQQGGWCSGKLPGAKGVKFYKLD